MHEYEEAGIAVPMMCMQCEDAACKKVCPVSAISQNEDGTTLIDFAKCIGCKMCISACPFGNISISFEDKKLVKCDLCGGSPRCAEFCPSNAIEYVEATGQNIMKKKDLARKFKEIVEEV